MSPAEQNLLGAIINSPSAYRDADGLVNGDDFEDARHGRVWDGLILMAASGQAISAEAVVNRFPEWGIRGLTAGDPWKWTTDARAYAVPEYATKVRNDSVRRQMHVVQDVLQQAANDPGSAPLDLATETRARLDRIIDGAASGRLATKSLGEILDDEDHYDWVIPHVLERRDRAILTGGEGAGKTTFCRQIVVLSAAGIHPLTFKRMEPIRWLVVDAENTETQWRRAVRHTSTRAAAYGAVSPLDRVHIKAGSRINITKGPHLSEIHRLIDIHKPDALYIGPLYKMVPGAINNDDDAAPLIVALDSLRDRGIALLMEAHAGKSTNMQGDRNLAPRGSSALLGWPEFGLGLAPMDEDPEMVKMVHWRGARDARDWPRHMMRGGDWPWTPVHVPT